MAKSRMVDQGIGFITIGDGICNQCEYVSEDGQRCKAFPQGIPERILTGEIDHHYPVHGDNGIQFKKRGE